MLKTLLLAINSKYLHSSLSVWILAESVRQYSEKPHTVKVIECTINQSISDIAEQVAAHKPDVVGISTYIWNAGMLPDLIKHLRQHLPDTLFVLGGPEASHNSQYWLDYADYVLCGEGERSFSALLDMLSEKDKKPRAIEALDRKQNHDAAINSESAGEFIDPYTDEYIEHLRGKIAYIETSRGCPFKCAFCLSGETSVKFLSIDKAKRQIDILSKSGARVIKFVDRTFNSLKVFRRKI